MLLSSILCSWIQLIERNKIWKFKENQLRKLNDTQSSKTMISSFLFSSSRLIFSLKTMILKAEYHYSFEIASSASSAKFNLSTLKVKRSMWKLITDWSFTSSLMIKNTLQTRHQQKRFEMLWVINTKRSYKSLRDNIWWTSLITECRWIFSLKRHEHISLSWLKRSSQHRKT